MACKDLLSGDPCPKSFLTALAQQAELPATWANSFSSWKASIAASILVQVLGEAVLSRVFKHCGHCTAPGLKAAMHLPQHPQNQVWVFLLTDFFCAVNFLVHYLGRCSQKLKSVAPNFPSFIFVSLVSKCTMPLERI